MRLAIGASAVLALGSAVIAWMNDDSTLAGVAARIGIILVAVWIAFPLFSEHRPRTYVGGLLAVAILLWRPRSAVILLPVLAYALARRPAGESQ